jgi:acetate kinase
MSLEEIETVLNRRSGFLGLSGSADARTVEEGAANGDEACSLALDVFVHRILRYIGAYWVNLNGRVDALVFSAGIGEHSPEVRRRVCRRLGWLKVELDDVKNEEARGGCAQEVQTSTSSVKVIVLPTDEELSIAEQALVAVRNAENGHVPRQ